MAQPPTIQSFLIRFITGDTSEIEAAYRGAIRHIQTGEEVRFTTWDEVERYLSRFVSLTLPQNQTDREREDGDS